jgi:hypothetical protein
LHGAAVSAEFSFFILHLIEQHCSLFADGTPYFKVIQKLNAIEGKDFKVGERQLNNLDDLASILKQTAFRGDLKQNDEGNIVPYGNTDIKLYSTSGHKFIIQSGPVQSFDAHENEAEEGESGETDTFEWTSFDDISHDEHPEVWNFPKVHVQYVWH